MICAMYKSQLHKIFLFQSLRTHWIGSAVVWYAFVNLEQIISYQTLLSNKPLFCLQKKLFLELYRMCFIFHVLCSIHVGHSINYLRMQSDFTVLHMSKFEHKIKFMKISSSVIIITFYFKMA